MAASAVAGSDSASAADNSPLSGAGISAVEATKPRSPVGELMGRLRNAVPEVRQRTGDRLVEHALRGVRLSLECGTLLLLAGVEGLLALRRVRVERRAHPGCGLARARLGTRFQGAGALHDLGKLVGVTGARLRGDLVDLGEDLGPALRQLVGLLAGALLEALGVFVADLLGGIGLGIELVVVEGPVEDARLAVLGRIFAQTRRVIAGVGPRPPAGLESDADHRLARVVVALPDARLFPFGALAEAARGGVVGPLRAPARVLHVTGDVAIGAAAARLDRAADMR